MISKRILAMFLVVIGCALAACNWTVGDCYPREEWERGAGASAPIGPPEPIFTSSAAGDFRAAPPGEPQGAGEREIQCNRTESSEESSEESPKGSSESSTDSTCSGPGDTAGDGQTFIFCSDACGSKCPTSGVNGFSPTIFNFVTKIEDDGTQTPGGWQEAAVDFKIKRWVDVYPEFWSCKMTIGVPLRNEAQGKISAELAAAISAKVSSTASRKIMRSDIHMPQGIFCFKFTEEMKVRMPEAVKGARVTKP
ncbi:hypothetical protein WMF45_36045 [Sorangium sp. So ce448]|uniref:hypothetical protein n=1 Tax=Sorangium sp. So ce448 TaxID=3133314 RepID=UPI003F61AAC5